MSSDTDEEATARAFAAIQATLQGFSSPMMGTQQPQTTRTTNDESWYEKDAMEWMQEELRDESNEATPMPLKTPKRTPLMERAGTPIMSNSSSSKNLAALSKPTPGSASGRSRYSLDDDDDDDSGDEIDEDGNAIGSNNYEPLPVQTPLQRKFKTVSAPPTTPVSSKKQELVRRSSFNIGGSHPPTATSVSLKQSVFRRHHDALWDYLTAKRNISERMELEREDRKLEEASNKTKNMLFVMDTDTDTDTDAISESLARDECQREVDYCRTLCQIGYGNASVLDASNNEGPMEEGHCWDLLASLRKLSLSALVWDDDPTSMTQNTSSQAIYLQQLTTKIHSTPKELVEAMSDPSSKSLPLILQRKRNLLAWIQSCLERESKDTKALLPTSTSSKIPSHGHPDDSNIPSLLSEMDSNLLKAMAQVCLALFLEGRDAEALDVARSRGQSWRAAAWMGGEPSGYTSRIRDDTRSVEDIPVGNPNRFLWKRQVWKTGRKLLLRHTSQQQQEQQQEQRYRQPSSPIALEEAAIYSILSDDVQNALDNPLIRSSWTRSLCVLLMGSRGRTRDEVLHRHNTYRRRGSACFPGYQFEEQENEQLMQTAQLGTMTEAQMATTLANSHFLKQQEQQRHEQQQQQHKTRRMSYKSAIMAFVVGKSAILELCARETSRIVSELNQVSEKGGGESSASNDEEYVNQDWDGVRFMTHLTLFLDSLQGSSTPIVCDGITDQKNAILFQYVQYLESRPDLWRMITLYVSLLPPPTILEYYPTVLARVLDDSERQTMTGQIRELMSSLELPLLRRVVRRSLSAPPTTLTGGDDVDAIKCNSLQWLLHKDEHLEDALICANILLREFFLNEEEDKTSVAVTLLNDYLPEDFLDLVSTSFAAKEESSDSSDSEAAYQNAKVNNAITEHLAYIGYLEAYGAFEKWKETLRATPTALEEYRLPNYSNLNEKEKAIADSNVLRSWVKEKKKHLETTLGAAEEARLSWHNVLIHPGGWLSVDDDEVASAGGDPEEQQRHSDILKIRSRHLVLAANLYHQVCEETAAWLSRSLHEAEDFHLPKEEVLQRLQFGSSRSSLVAVGGGNRSSSSSSSGGSSHATPEYWYKHALDLAVLVASDKHGIHKAFPSADLQELITKLGETAVSKLMNV